MDGVIPLIIFCGLVVPLLGFGIASWRRKNRLRREIVDLGRRLGVRRFGADTGLPYGWINDPITGDGYSQTSKLFDHAFSAEYRGRLVVALEFTKVDPTDGTSRTRHHAVQLVGLPTPRLRILPHRSSIRTDRWLALTETRTGVPEFDRRYRVLAEDPDAARKALSPAVLHWFVRRPEGRGTLITFAGDGLEVTAEGVLPGWDTTRLINDLVDLADLVQYGEVRPGPRLELSTRPPPGNGALTGAAGCVLVADLIFWLGAFTISNPRSGFAVIGLLSGLVVLVFVLALRRQRRRAR